MSAKELARILEAEEGRVPYVYLDHLGFQTIGVGRLVDSKKGGRLRDSEINFMLSNDIFELKVELLRVYPWMVSLSPVRLDTMILMRFQLGLVGMAKFVRTLSAVKQGNWEIAAQGLRNSLWAKQTPERVERLAKQLETDTYQYKDG